MARRTRYREDHKSFGEFMLSSQVLDPVMQLCRVIAAEAAATDDSSIREDYGVTPGPPVTVAGNPRITGRVVNTNPKAAAYEFGTGSENEGESGGVVRTSGRGGSSPARRHLGYIAAGYHDVIGDPG